MPQLMVFVLLFACFGLAAAWLITFTRSTRRLQQAGVYTTSLMEQTSTLEQKLNEALSELKRRAAWLDHQEDDIKWYKKELVKRPRLERKTYKILTLGIKGTGKTSLTLKWSNPLTDLGTIEGTKIERYERSVSHVLDNDVLSEHVFEIGDWGGEHIVEAQHELIREEIHGLLVVVDLGGEGANVVEADRIQQQIREFEPQVLRFLFGPTMVTTCKTVVLFINKSDLIPGTPSHIEAEATRLFRPLITSLMTYAPQVDICILVGSASSGHNTHHLFSHFVEKILPSNAYDEQLLQRIKRNGGGSRGSGVDGV